jgi:glycosyltransferase involved in cell wall biosynthesis
VFDLFARHFEAAETDDPLSRIQYVDIKTYLVDDILTKVDRASMAVSLEVRVPLLDHVFMERMARIPSRLKLRGREGKYIFKRALEARLSRDTLYRRKMGFSVPLADWWRGELRGGLRGERAGAGFVLQPASRTGGHARPVAGPAARHARQRLQAVDLVRAREVGRTLRALGAAMHVLYHHRTTGQDAQGIHIQEILRAFRSLGHTTELVSFADRRRRAAPAPPAVNPHAATRREGAHALRTPQTNAIDPAAERTEVPAAGGGERYTALARLRNVALVYELAELAYNIWGFWALAAAVRRRRPAVLYERYSLFNFSGVLVSRLWRIPMLLEVNAPLAYEKEQYEKLVLRRLAYALERWICSSSKRTIVVSTPMRKILAQQGVPDERMVVISNGVNTVEIAAALGRCDVRARYGIGAKLVLGFVGWFKPWHRLDSVIELLAARPAWRERIHLLLVGDGPETPALRALVQAHGLETSVTFTGPVGRETIYDHIDAFDVALQPHVTDYASPMKIFEYLALGKCVVAPDLENIREILDHGVDALLFHAGDAADMGRAIEVLVNDPERVQRMGEAARHKIEARRYFWVENARRALAAAGLDPGPATASAPAPQPALRD